MTRRIEIFERQAAYCDGRSPQYATLLRRLAHDARVDAVLPSLSWDMPLRLLGGLHYLVLAGRTSWDSVDEALEREQEFLARFVEQPVQTNEVRRAWALLPALLSAGGERVDLIELGASAGLLLAADRYDYRYAAGTWGPGDEKLVLDGEERGHDVPSELLARRLEVSRRIGLDLDPIALDEHGARLLEAFVWPDQVERVERLRRAIAVARTCSVDLRRGDYVELLPSVLADRSPDALAIVFHSISATYLPPDRYERLVEVLEAAGREAPLAWVSFEGPRGDPDYVGVDLDLTVWPDGRRRRLARADYHAAWLEWGGA